LITVCKQGHKEKCLLILYINLAGKSGLLNWPLKPDRLEIMLRVPKPCRQAGEGGAARSASWCLLQRSLGKEVLCWKYKERGEASDGVDAGSWTWLVPFGFHISAICGWSTARWQCSTEASGLVGAEGTITLCIKPEKLCLGSV